MPAAKTIRMTLTGPFKGVTKLFGRYQFIDGICDFTGNDEQVANVAKYFTRSYQVGISDPCGDKVEADEVEGDVDDDSAIISDEEITEQEEQETDPPVPTQRQAHIIAAVNCIDKEEWVDKQAETPRPKVKDVQTQAKDPTISKMEIVEVIKTWLS